MLLRPVLKIIAASLVALLCVSASADSWRLPSTETLLSPDKQWRLTIIPKELKSQLAYFEDKVASRPNAGAVSGKTQQTALGRMEHLEGGRWKLIWNAPLVNEVAPVDAVVSSHGWSATFDDWHGVGHGPNVVVIYDEHGHMVRQLALSDILPKTYIHVLPSSVSSNMWGGEHHFSADGTQLILRVVVPTDPMQPGKTDKRDKIEIALDTATGKVNPPPSLEWDRAWKVAQSAHAKVSAEEARMLAEFKAPLVAPGEIDESVWYRYVGEACARLDPEMESGRLRTAVLGSAADEDNGNDLQRLKDVLDPADWDSSRERSIFLASPDPQKLVRVVAHLLAKQASPPSLTGIRICMTLTPDLLDAAAKAISPSGALLIPLDITRPVPQHPARMKQLEGFMTQWDDDRLPWAK